MEFPEMIDVIEGNTDGCWTKSILIKDSLFYESRMKGNTGILKSINELINLNLPINQNISYVILEMTLDNILYEGTLFNFGRSAETYIGNGLSKINEMGVIVEGSGHLSSKTAILTNHP